MLSTVVRQSFHRSFTCSVLERTPQTSQRMISRLRRGMYNHALPVVSKNESLILWRRRHQASSSSSSTINNHRPATNNPFEEFRWIPSLLGRLFVAFGTLHIFSEYGLELTLCEGPSMYPTIHHFGEVILIDKLSPRLCGIQGGCVGSVRTMAARKRQEGWMRRSTAVAQQQQLEQKQKNARITFDTTSEVYQWHEPRIPINELPSAGSWGRFWNQLTTGISVGDVVVVQHPDRPGTVCKRILGLPGDCVIRPPATMRQSRVRGVGQQRQPQRSMIIIPDGHIWIEGDNSSNSADSRNYGPVPAALIVGRVLFRVWPLRGNALLQRGAPPRPPEGVAYSYSLILPAGYEGEEIIKAFRHALDRSKRNEQ